MTKMQFTKLTTQERIELSKKVNNDFFDNNGSHSFKSDILFDQIDLASNIMNVVNDLDYYIGKFSSPAVTDIYEKLLDLYEFSYYIASQTDSNLVDVDHG